MDENKGNKFRGKRTPKKKETVKIEMNKTVNPELEERKELTDLEFLEEMITQIGNRKTQILAQIKQSRDMLKILQIDLDRTKSLYNKERKREVLKHGKKDA